VRSGQCLPDNLKGVSLSQSEPERLPLNPHRKGKVFFLQRGNGPCGSRLGGEGVMID
jgi:hypothetical protein